MAISTQETPPARRWYQFSLRTLLIVMTLFTVGVGGLGGRMHQARRHRDRVAADDEAVAAFEKLGGSVEREYEQRRPRT